MNPRIYIPGSSNSLMFEFEVDNFLDINEGCYPTTQSDFIFAPEVSASDCAYIHSDDDFYALSSPLKNSIDDSLKGLCRGYSSAEIEGLINQIVQINVCLIFLSYSRILPTTISQIIKQGVVLYYRFRKRCCDWGYPGYWNYSRIEYY